MDAMMTSSTDVWVCAPDGVSNTMLSAYRILQKISSGTVLQRFLKYSGALCPLDIAHGPKAYPIASRVLRPSGTFLYVTFGQPHFRRRFLTGPHSSGTKLEIRELGESFHYYMYILRKMA